jgi:hypothetical protein
VDATWIKLLEKRVAVSDLWEQKKRREPFLINSKILILLVYTSYAGMKFSFGWRSYNRVFLLYKQIKWRRKQTILETINAVASEANYWTLLQDSLCPLLQVVSSIPSCRLVKETLQRRISMNFDYFISASTDFVLLDDTTFFNIIKVCFS